MSRCCPRFPLGCYDLINSISQFKPLYVGLPHVHRHILGLHPPPSTLSGFADGLSISICKTRSTKYRRFEWIIYEGYPICLSLFSTVQRRIVDGYRWEALGYLRMTVRYHENFQLNGSVCIELSFSTWILPTNRRDLWTSRKYIRLDPNHFWPSRVRKQWQISRSKREVSKFLGWHNSVVNIMYWKPLITSV